MKRSKKIFRTGLILLLILVLFVLGVDYMVSAKVRGKTYDSCDSIPENKVGLLLGTIKILDNGNVNLFYRYRINAAVELYNAGKIEFVLVSGDNGRKEYDEPTTIKEDLIANGIPENRIYLDYAGFRTYDSVIRAKEIFGQENITIISQKFHNERAIYIGAKKGIDAVGFNASDVQGNTGLKVYIRERFARVKMLIDIVFGQKPKFLGEKIEIR